MKNSKIVLFSLVMTLFSASYAMADEELEPVLHEEGQLIKLELDHLKVFEFGNTLQVVGQVKRTDPNDDERIVQVGGDILDCQEAAMSAALAHRMLIMEGYADERVSTVTFLQPTHCTISTDPISADSQPLN